MRCICATRLNRNDRDLFEFPPRRLITLRRQSCLCPQSTSCVACSGERSRSVVRVGKGESVLARMYRRIRASGICSSHHMCLRGPSFLRYPCRAVNRFSRFSAACTVNRINLFESIQWLMGQRKQSRCLGLVSLERLLLRKNQHRESDSGDALRKRGLTIDLSARASFRRNILSFI